MAYSFMVRFAKNISLLMFGTVLVVAVSGEAKEYVVKKGDTYASIARQFYGEPVFGPRGTINTIYRLNPKAQKNSALEPGDKVVLADDTDKPSKHAAVAVAPPPKKHAPPGKSLLPDEAVLPKHVSGPSSGPSSRPVDPHSAKKLAELPDPHEPHEAPAPMVAEFTKAHDATGEPPIPPEDVHAATPVPPEVAKVPEPPACPVCPPPPHLPPPHEAFAAHAEKESAHHESHESAFSVIPQYSFVSQKATENASGASLDAKSELAWGIELGWDKEWNESFSTLLTYSFSQMRSSEKNEATGSPVFDNTVLNRVELTLFNNIGSRVRAGFGAAYGDHVFIENVAETPTNAGLYKVAFLNPMLAAEIKAYESHEFEAQIALKVAMLHAQTGQGHDLKQGTEWAAQIALIQKFTAWSLLYGVSYASEDQTRTDATETRSELALKLGVLF